MKQEKAETETESTKRSLLKNKYSLQRSKNKKPAKDFGPPWQVIGAMLLIFIVSQVIAAVIVGIILALTSSTADSYSALANSAPAQFFYILIAEGLAVYLVLYILKRRGLSLANIGLSRAPKGGDVAKALLGFVTFFGLIIVISAILSALFPELKDQEQDIGFDNLNSSIDRVLAFVALVVLAPIGEEVLVRGYLYSGLRAHLNMVRAMIITSLIFGVAHLQLGSGAAIVWAAGINTFVLSLVLVYLREKTGALYAGMLIHSTNNLIAFGVHFV